MPVTVTTRVEDEVVKDLDRIAAAEAIDRSSVIRRFLTSSLEEWKIGKSLEDYEKGKVTLWQAARKCGISLWEMIDKAKEKRTHVPYGLDELREDLKGLS